MIQAVETKVFNVLFLCTGNSARSIMAEVIMNRAGAGKFKGFSAGSQPKGQVHPYALDLLRKLHYDVDRLALEELDGVFQARTRRSSISSSPSATTPRSEICPMWPGQPMTAHWGIPDPAAATAPRRRSRLAFAERCRMLTNRIGMFVSLPLRALDKLTLQKRLDAIGTAKEAARGKPARRPDGRGARSAAAAACGRGAGHRASGGGRGRLRHHGGAAGRRQSSHRAARQHDPDRRDPGRAHHHFRPRLRRAFQSGGVAGVCRARRHALARGAPLYRRASAPAASPAPWWRI